MKNSFVACIGFAVLCASLHAADAESDKKALAAVNVYVGEWRGAGSNKGDAPKDAWAEDGEWAWDFSGGRAALVFKTEKGRYFSAGRLEPDDKAGAFKFTGTLPDGKAKEELSGEIDKEGDLVLTNASPAEGRPARLVISTVAKGKRLLMTYQKKRAKDYAPIAEVGMTRKGSGFGQQSDERECVITGGQGTIAVSFQGKTYWVCCGGCKQSFLDNPEKELAAYKKRKEEEKAAKK
jgi:YHS domain-containing protein